MNPEDFENELRRRPLRAIPPEWRAEILRACRHAAADPSKVVACPVPHFRWRDWLWPNPQAWAGLATVWIMVLCLNWITPRSDGAVAIAVTTPSASLAATNLAEQRRELARLLDNTFEPAPTRKSSAPPGPRSERVAPPRV